MNIETLYKSLDGKLTTEAKRAELIYFLKNQNKSIPSNNTDKAKLAYDIAGLMSTSYAKSLSNSDKIETILIIAGELEIKSESNDNQWIELTKLISDL